MAYAARCPADQAKARDSLSAGIAELRAAVHKFTAPPRQLRFLRPAVIAGRRRSSREVAERR
jgi:hypothetical protein